MPAISIILPVYNEDSGTLGQFVNQITAVCSGLNKDAEILIVDDGSTVPVTPHDGVRVIRHPYNMGNGAAVKTGARHAQGEILIFSDADGQHNPQDIPALLQKLDEGFDMVVGARSADDQASIGRRIGNKVYNKLASWIVNQRVLDLTSGYRAVRAEKFKEFLYLLPNGFSYPTTITMSFFRTGFPVAYLPITVRKRNGKSHIHPLKDSIRFLLIIFKIGTLYSPLKVFLPLSAVHFAFGAAYYTYTYLTTGRFTNMGAVLLTTSIVIFLIGLVSEQITAMIYQRSNS